MKKERKKRKIFSFLEKRSRHIALLIEVLITVFFIALIVLLSFLSFSMVRLAELELENSTERAFNAVIMALRDNDINMNDVMSSYGINGVGIYSASGNLLYSEGSVYQRLPISLFRESERNSLTSSRLSFDARRNIVEYIRASSQAVIPQNGSLLLPINEISLSYPNIIYINLDASGFGEELMHLRVLFIALIILSLVLYIIVLYIYRQNRKYKETLVRQESLVSLGSAARTLTHEIKNPLSAIKIQLAILRRSVKGDELEGIYTIEHETTRIKELTDKVSDFLRNPLGNPMKIDIVKEVKSLFPLFSTGIETVSGSVESAFVLFDRERMRSVFENLIKNAVEATEEGKRPEVSVSFARIKRGRILVSVNDRGCGISDESRQKIFDPFYTTKIHGSGIGLSIASQFVKAAGGELSIKSRSGGGTSAIVILNEVIE